MRTRMRQSLPLPITPRWQTLPNTPVGFHPTRRTHPRHLQRLPTIGKTRLAAMARKTPTTQLYPHLQHQRPLRKSLDTPHRQPPIPLHLYQKPHPTRTPYPTQPRTTAPQKPPTTSKGTTPLPSFLLQPTRTTHPTLPPQPQRFPQCHGSTLQPQWTNLWTHATP